ncbi:MAG: hypothetical protein HY438_02330 [DPANN group archaeon]|nr:hypothetical protein [DPANN group archaeon]
MTNKPERVMSVAIISSFAEDRLIFANEKTECREGGPALFISNVFKKCGIPFKLFCGEKAIVEIDMRNNIEKGRVKSISKIITNSNKTFDFALVSTLLNEFSLKRIANFNCLDIQGYVRDGSDFGKKKFFDSEELENFDIIKATEEEIKYLSKQRVSKIKLLLLTRGSNGFEIIQNECKYDFSVDKIYSSDTIGAGDTFFAAFCIKYYLTNDIFQSARFATKTVADFLKSKEKK